MESIMPARMLAFDQPEDVTRYEKKLINEKKVQNADTA